MSATLLRSNTSEQSNQFVGASIAAHDRLGSNLANFPTGAISTTIASQPRVIVPVVQVGLKVSYAPLWSGIASIPLPAELTFNRSIASTNSTPATRQSLQIDQDLVSSHLFEGDDQEDAFWRGTFALPSNTNVLFSTRTKVKIDALPSWEPYISIDSDRFEDDDD
jgi:hypothetical protein